MKVLLDTCVLSELRHPKGHPEVRRAVAALDEKELFLSVISIGEILKGISLLAEGSRKHALASWLDTLERDYGDRILSVDRDICRRWGELTARAQRAGRPVSATDGLIAATALHHGLQVMTRDTADFEPTGVSLLNPWRA
jgi:predicted nucleic acid-binding protein